MLHRSLCNHRHSMLRASFAAASAVPLPCMPSRSTMRPTPCVRHVAHHHPISTPRRMSHLSQCMHYSTPNITIIPPYHRIITYVFPRSKRQRHHLHLHPHHRHARAARLLSPPSRNRHHCRRACAAVVVIFSRSHTCTAVVPPQPLSPHQ